MYTIRLDDTLMFDPRVDELEIFDARAQFEVNKTNGLDFTVYPSHPLYARFKRFKSIVELYQNNLLLFRGRVLNDEAGLYNEKKIICEGELAYFNDTIIRPFEFQGTIEGFLSYIISQHNSQVENIKKFTLGNVTVTNSTNNIVRSSIDAQTSWEIINNRLIKLLGGYIVLRRENNINYIDYLADSNYMSLQKIELGKNLLDLTRRINGDEVITALIPYGAKIDEQSDERITIKSVNNNIDYIYDQEAVEKHGWIFGTETWDDVTIPSNLLTKARQTLAAGILLNSSIELTALDLSLMDISIDEFRIFEYVKVEVPTHLIDDNLLISKMSLDILSPENNKLTLGLDIQTFTERQIQTEKAISNIVTIKGPKGDSGNDGVAGKDGVGIKTTAITYVGSTSGTTAPTSGWTTTIPIVADGNYLWTRTTWTYTDNTTEAGYSAARMGTNGATGQSVTAINPQFYLSTSKTTQTGGQWKDKPDLWTPGKYMWTRNKVVYKDPIKTEYTDPTIDSSWEAIDEIEIGGRNYFSIKAWNAKPSLISNGVPYMDIQLQLNTQYTLSTNIPNREGLYDVFFFNGTDVISSDRNGVEKGSPRTLTSGADGIVKVGMRSYDNNLNTGLNWIMLSQGNKATDWTPAPEDIQAELDDKASNDYVTSVETTLNTTIEESAGFIRAEVEETYTAKSKFETYQETVSTEFQQTKNQFNFTFTDLIEQIETLDGETKATFDEIVKYIRFVDGNIVLGKVGNELELKIRHDRIQFLQSGAEVAYFSNNKLYVTDGEFINSLKLGNFAFIPRENGSLDFRKVVN